MSKVTRLKPLEGGKGRALSLPRPLERVRDRNDGTTHDGCPRSDCSRFLPACLPEAAGSERRTCSEVQVPWVQLARVTVRAGTREEP